MKGAPWKAFLAAALLLGGALRVWDLPQRGLCYYDEGSHWRMAYAPAQALRTCLSSLAMLDLPSFETIKTAVMRHGFPDTYFAAHHGYAALQSLVMAVLGMRLDAGLWVNAFLGTLTLVWVYRIGALLGGRRIGLAAALLTAVSANHVFYSRSALSQAASLFWMYGGAWFLFCWFQDLRSSRSLRWGGILWGSGLVCHYNLFWTLPLAGAAAGVGGILERPQRPIAAFLRPVLIFASGAALPLAAVEVATRLLGSVGIFPYSREFIQQFSINTSGYSVSHSTPLFYLIHWVRTEGILFTALAGFSAAAAALAFARRAGRSFLPVATLAALVVGGHVLYTPLPLKAARTLLVGIPASCALVAWFAFRMPRHWLAWGLVVGALAGMCPMTLRAVRGRSPYPEVIAQADRRGGELVTVDDYTVLQTYLQRDDILVAQVGNESWRVPLTRTRRQHPGRPLFLAALRRNGRYNDEDPVWHERFSIVRELRQRAQEPIASIPFGQPLEFDYVDVAFRWDRLWGLKDVDYRVDLFDLESLR